MKLGKMIECFFLSVIKSDRRRSYTDNVSHFVLQHQRPRLDGPAESPRSHPRRWLSIAPWTVMPSRSQDLAGVLENPLPDRRKVDSSSRLRRSQAVTSRLHLHLLGLHERHADTTLAKVYPAPSARWAAHRLVASLNRSRRSRHSRPRRIESNATVQEWGRSRRDRFDVGGDVRSVAYGSDSAPPQHRTMASRAWRPHDPAHCGAPDRRLSARWLLRER